MENFDWNNIDGFYFSFQIHSDPEYATNHERLNVIYATSLSDTDDMFITAEDGTRDLAPDAIPLLRESIANEITLSLPGRPELSELDKEHITALLAGSFIWFQPADRGKWNIATTMCLTMAAMETSARGERTINLLLSISHWHFRPRWSPNSFNKISLENFSPMLEEALCRLNANDEMLTELDLSSNEIGPAGAKALAEALAKNSSFMEGGLDLSDNDIGDEGSKALAHALTKNSTLPGVCLNNNNIGADGAKALADALTKNSTIRGMGLSDNDIGADGAEALADALTKNSTMAGGLDLSDNDIGDDGAKALAKALIKNSTLTELHLAGNNISPAGAKALAEALTKNSTIRGMDLSNNGIGDEGAKALADALTKNKALMRLDLRVNRICADGAKALNHIMTTKPDPYLDIAYDGDEYISPVLGPWRLGKSFFLDLISRHLEK